MALILVVDDSPDARRLLMKALEHRGHAAVPADSGRRALQLARELKPDLLLLDISMPQFDGFDVLQALPRKGQRPVPPVVIVSASFQQSQQKRALALGAEAYFVKGTFDFDALLDRVEEIVSPHVLGDEADRWHLAD